jgi:broad specificity phosphatase PhoE
MHPAHAAAKTRRVPRMRARRWPSTLWIVRHGESAGNVARDKAQARGAERIELTARDVDVPLSPRGETQARSLGEWFAAGDVEDRPEVLLVSPYVRAQNTARLFRKAGGAAGDEPICIDERLREKEFGVLDRRAVRAGAMSSSGSAR